MRLRIQGLDKESARKVFESIKTENDLNSLIGTPETNVLFPLREKILEIKENIPDAIGTYSFDYKFAFGLYELLNSYENFNESIASNYQIWNRLNLYCVPDVICERHGLNPDYFYLKNNRSYLAVMWWFVHLCKQETKEQTYNLLSQIPSTDYIMQLVDRASGNGVYLETSRLIMNKLISLPRSIINETINGQNLFRRVMMQDVARRSNTNLIFENNALQYVKELFLKCGVNLDEYN